MSGDCIEACSRWVKLQALVDAHNPPSLFDTGYRHKRQLGTLDLNLIF